MRKKNKINEVYFLWSWHTSPNPYISRRLNNIDEMQAMKKKQDDWTKMYYKILKRLEAMIDVQRQVKNIMKIAEEMNMTVIEIEGTILIASINN